MAFAAGGNNYKQLGEPEFTSTESLQFMRVGDYLGLMKIEAVSAGDGFSLALNDKGEVFAWGYNYYRNLGLGDTTANKDTPTILGGDLSGKRVVSIAACKYHGLMTAMCMHGVQTRFRMLENGLEDGLVSIKNRIDPLPQRWLISKRGRSRLLVVNFIPSYSQTKINSTHGAVIWMDKWAGERLMHLVPYPNLSLPGITTEKIYYGRMLLLERCTTLLLISMVTYTRGVLTIQDKLDFVNGEGAPQSNATIPRLVFPSNTTFAISIAASQSSTFIALNDGRAYSWGSNSYGELGVPSDGTRVLTPTQITIVGSLGVKELKSRAFSRAIYALTANNNTIAWGDNLSGQLGIGSKGSQYATPQTIGDQYTSLQYRIYPSPSLSHSLYLVEGLSCFALLAFDELVCSGHGVCSSFDNCSCDSGYAGKDCSLPICYDLHAGEPEVCSGHGQCLTVDTCLCQTGYTGEKCEKKDAFCTVPGTTAMDNWRTLLEDREYRD